MNKIKSLLKISPIAMVVAGVLVAGVASAAILAVYTTMAGYGDVEQSVVFSGGDASKSYSINTYAGNTSEQCYNLRNRAEVVAPIEFRTTQCVDGSGNCVWNNGEYSGSSVAGLTTTYWGSVKLEEKDENWNVESNGKEALLKYQLASDDFNYQFEAKGLEGGEEYSLIYYADYPERFDEWGGDNPGALIAEFTTDEEGNIYAEGTESQPVESSKNLGMNLPSSPDWNATAEANYCDNDEGDDYNLCRGAKVWLVLSEDYNKSDEELTSWNPSEYLFETDLIAYNDTNISGGLMFEKGLMEVCAKTTADVALVPDTYNVITEVKPAQ